MTARASGPVWTEGLPRWELTQEIKVDSSHPSNQAYRYFPSGGSERGVGQVGSFTPWDGQSKVRVHKEKEMGFP